MQTAYLENAIRAFHERVTGTLAHDVALEYTVEPGIAGLTVRLLYDKGRLSRGTATDPGGGLRDVTRSIKTLLTVPLVLSRGRGQGPVPDGLEVGGVVYLEHEALAVVNAAKAGKDLPTYRDVGEAAADALLHEDRRVPAKTPLNMFCTEILHAAGVTFSTHYEAMLRGQELGLRVNRPHLRICPGIPELIASCRHLRETADSFPYEVEGVIIRVNRLDLRAGKGPWALALHFGEEQRAVS